MFHDQGQIALKLIGLGRGITLLAGFPVPIATPGHGTAYDIAGTGTAKPDGLIAATRLVLSMMGNEMNAHVWERIDLGFAAEGTYANPYTEVVVWVDLEGPGFQKRVYGFWNGGQDFVVRVLATAPGTWRWTSGSTPADPGLAGKSGSFEAVAWSEAELEANPNRRGMIRASADGRGLEYADGTPFFLIGDTWWSVPSYRFPLAAARQPQAARTRRDAQRLRPPPQGAGLQLRRADRGAPGMGQRRQAADHHDGRRHLRPRGVEAAGHQLGQGHAQRGRAALPVPRKGARLRGRDARPRPHQPRVLQGARREDRLPQRARLRALHRGLAARRRAGVEEVPRLRRRATRATCSTCSRATRPTSRSSRPSTTTTTTRPSRRRSTREPIDADARALRQAAVRHPALGQPQPLDAGQLRRRTRGSTCTRAATCASTTPTGT